MPRMIFVSESTDYLGTDQGSFAACLAYFILEIDDNDVKALTSSFRKWYGNSKKFAAAHGVGKEFDAVARKCLAKGLSNTNQQDMELVVNLGAAIKANRSSFEKDLSITRDIYDLIKDCGANLYNDSDAAHRRIAKRISILRQPKLSEIFAEDDLITVDAPAGLDAKKASKAIKPLVLKLTGRDYGYFMTPKERKAAVDNQPKTYEQFSPLAKVLNKEIKKQVFMFVRKSGKPMVKVAELVKYLNKQGLVHNLPEGFTGVQVDENYVFYTAEGRKLDKVPYGTVKLNPKYDPQEDNTYVAFTVIPGEVEIKYRTLDFNKKNKEVRFTRVQEFLNKEDKLVATWRKDLNRKGTKEQILAAVVELMYTISARIGGKDNQTKGEPTYGLTTILRKHLKINKASLVFDYPGKKGTSQASVYKINTPIAKKVYDIIVQMVKDAEPDEPVFMWRGKPVIRMAVVLYMKAKGINISPHDMRRINGTKAAKLILEKSPFLRAARAGRLVKQSDVDKWFREEMKHVGEILHHRTGESVTGMTAVKAYISPYVMHQFYQDLGLRAPKFLPPI